MKYLTVYSETPWELDEHVNKFLADGWELFGTQNVCALNGTLQLFQALVKKA